MSKPMNSEALGLLIALTLLVGCDDTTAYPEFLNAGSEVCEVNGGLNFVKIGYSENSTRGDRVNLGRAYCNNGGVFRIEYKRASQ